MKKKNKCNECGKKGLRYCPAILDNICPRCCGIGRNNKYICPSICEHNPLGEESYDLFCQVDNKWINKASRIFKQKVTKPLFDKTAKKILYNNELTFMGVLFHYLLVHHITEEGISLGQQWLKENVPPLNNDEILLTKYKLKSYPTVIEIQKIINDYSVECIDVFDPEKKTIILYDRANASNTVRFANLLVWLTPLPFFSRPEGGLATIPENISNKFLNYIKEQTVELYGDNEKENISKFLAENFSDCVGLIEEMHENQYKEMLNNMDLHQCIGWYKILAKREDIIEILNNKPDFEYEDDQSLKDSDPEGTDYYTWLRLGESQKIEENMITPIKNQADSQMEIVGGLGKITLQPEYFIIEMLSKQKYYFAEEMIEKYFGDKLYKEKESINDLAKQFSNKRFNDEENDFAFEDNPPYESKVPFEIEKELIQKTHKSHYTNLLDEQIPMIDNMTPREAAKISAMRPKLIELFKLHINNIEKDNKRRGFDLNIDWVLEELGLNELII